MGLLDGVLGGVVGAAMVNVVNGLIEKHGGTKFSLETKLKDTLPDSFPFSKYNTETIRNLLNMQTGYADYTKPPSDTAGLPDGAAPIERVPVSVLCHVSINFVVKVSYSSPVIWVSVRK